MIKFKITFFFIFIVGGLFAQTNYYWIGGGGNWNDIFHWSLTIGGTTSGAVPAYTDNVFFDVFSGFHTTSNKRVNVNIII
ncbi:MAG: hypothetical protein LBV69_09595 [Bacteroidales bacterium]|nr:hypothetical protein [Bacteroidales bacterium]